MKTTQLASRTRWESTIERPGTDDVDAIHRLVMSGFPSDLPQPARHSAGVLWAKLPGSDRLVVSSLIPPVPDAWSHHADGAFGGAQGGSPGGSQSTLVSFPTSTDEVYRFTATINPTRQQSNRGRRNELMPCNPVRWLVARSERLGCEMRPSRITVLDERTCVDTRERAGQRMTITIRTAVVTGLVVATDVDRLAEAWANGIGRERAYGAGLIFLEAA